MGEAEDRFQTESKENEDLFLEKLKQGKNYDTVEKEYIKKSAKTRKLFEKRYDQELKNQKDAKKKKKEKKEKEEVLNVERLDLSESKMQRFKHVWSMRMFHIGRFLAKVGRFAFIDFFRYIYYRFKYFNKGVKVRMTIMKDKTGKWFVKLGKSIKETFKKMKELLGSFLGLLMFWKKRKKKKKKKKDKVEEDGDSKEGSGGET